MTRTKYLKHQTVKGHDYLFFRHKGKQYPLPLDQSSPAFAAAYDNYMRTLGVKAPAPTLMSAGSQAKAVKVEASIGNAIDVYMQSLEYRALKDRTRDGYNLALERLRERLGHTLLKDLTLDLIDVYSEKVAIELKGSQADLQVCLIRTMWPIVRKHPQFGITGMANPAIEAAKRYTVKQPYRAWSDKELEAFFAKAPANERLAMLLLWFCGQRGGDAVKMKWSHFDGQGLQVQPEKTHEHEAEACYVQCPEPLRDALLAAPRRSEFILTRGDGKPWKDANLLGKAVRRGLLRAGLATEGHRTISMHGLRKRAAKDAAEIGGVAGAQSVTLHKSTKMAAYYAKGADQKRINAKTVEAWALLLVSGTTGSRRSSAGLIRRKSPNDGAKRLGA